MKICHECEGEYESTAWNSKFCEGCRFRRTRYTPYDRQEYRAMAKVRGGAKKSSGIAKKWLVRGNIQYPGKQTTCSVVF